MNTRREGRKGKEREEEKREAKKGRRGNTVNVVRHVIVHPNLSIGYYLCGAHACQLLIY